MNLTKTIEQYNHNNVHFCEPFKNNVMVNGSFIRILYSTKLFTMNGIYLSVPLNDVMFEKYYQKYKCTFNGQSNLKVTDKICIVESKLLQKAGTIIKNKIPQYKIQEQLKNSHVKIFSDDTPKPSSSCFLLKISGIWETETHYGVTYKFSLLDNIK